MAPVSFEEFKKRRYRGESADDIFSEASASKPQSNALPSFEEYRKMRLSGKSAEEIFPSQERPKSIGTSWWHGTSSRSSTKPTESAAGRYAALLEEARDNQEGRQADIGRTQKTAEQRLRDARDEKASLAGYATDDMAYAQYAQRLKELDAEIEAARNEIRAADKAQKESYAEYIGDRAAATDGDDWKTKYAKSQEETASANEKYAAAQNYWDTYAGYITDDLTAANYASEQEKLWQARKELQDQKAVEGVLGQYATQQDMAEQYYAAQEAGMGSMEWYDKTKADYEAASDAYDAAEKEYQDLVRKRDALQFDTTSGAYLGTAGDLGQGPSDQEIEAARQRLNEARIAKSKAGQSYQYADALRYTDWEAQGSDISSGKAQYEADTAQHEEEVAGLREQEYQDYIAGGGGGTGDVWTESLVQQYERDWSYKGPAENWTDDERDNFYSLYAKDKRIAEEYAIRVNNQHAAAEYAAKIQPAQEWAGIDVSDSDWNNWLHGQGAIIAGVVTAPEKTLDWLDKVAQLAGRGVVMEKAQPLLSDYAEAMVQQHAFDLNEKYGTVMDGVFEGKGIGDLYQLEESILQSIVYGRLMGAAGFSSATSIGLSAADAAEVAGHTASMFTSAVFFGSAASSALDDARKAGADPREAFWYSVFAGANEAAFEYFSMDKLMSMDSPATLAQFFKQMLSQAFVEGSEEFNTSVANALAQQMFLKDKSDLNRNIDSYLAQGMSYDRAHKAAISEWCKELANDFAGGFISGGLSGGAVQGLMSVSQNQPFYEAGVGSISNQVDAAMDVLTGRTTPEQSRAKAETALRGAGFTMAQTEAAINENRYEAPKVITQDDTIAALTGASEKLESQGVKDDKLVNAIAAVALQEKADRTDAINRQPPTKQQQRLVEENELAQEIVRQLEAEAITEEGKQKVTWQDKRADVKLNGESVKIVGAKDGKVVIQQNGEKKTVETKDLEGLSDGYRNLLDLASTTEGGTAMLESYQPGQDVKAFARAWNVAFSLLGAQTEMTAEQARKYGSSALRALTNAQLEKALLLGRENAKEQGIAQRDKLTGQVEYWLGGKIDGTDYDGVTEEEARELLGDEEMTLLTEVLTKVANITLVKSKKGKNGKYEGAQGIFYRNGHIVLDVNAGMIDEQTGQRTIVLTAAHELTHFIRAYNPAGYKALRSFITRELVSKGLSLERLTRQKMDRSATKMSYDEAMEEVIADACETMLTDTSKLKAFANAHPAEARTIGEWLGNFLNKISSAFTGLKTAHTEAEAMQDRIEELRKMWFEALAQANKNATAMEASDPSEVVQEHKTDTGFTSSIQSEGNVMMSLRTFEEDGRANLMAFLDEQVRNHVFSEEEARQMMEQIEELYKVCKDYDNGKYAPFSAWSNAQVVSIDGRPVFSVVKQNGEYKLNLDFSLVCKKRRTLDAVFNEMIRRGIMNDFRMGQGSIAKINEIIRDHGFEVACGLCFVDSKRYRQAMIADAFCKMYNMQVFSLMKGTGAKVDSFNFGGDATIINTGEGIDTLPDSKLNWEKVDEILRTEKKGTVKYKIADHLKNNPQDRKLVSRGDFMSTAGFDQLKIRNPELLSIYNSKKGAGGPKAAQSDVQYLNEIIKQGQFNVKDAYEVGGVRIQSFSDYVGRLVFDYVQMVADLSAKKLPAHSYTKEFMFAQQFGLTGIKINMSLVPEVVKGIDKDHAGLDADGNYTWKDGQSFGSTVYDNNGKRLTANEGFELAKKIQNAEGYSKNCGTIAVGVSRAHIEKMLDDPEIRMIIPYHKSGLNHLVAAMNQIDKYTDYTNVQNTREFKNGKWSRIPAAKEFNWNDTLQRMQAEGKGAKEAANAYLDWCTENGYKAKFDEFAGHPNYYKLLEDFSCYDKDGTTSTPLGAVQMNFPTENDAFGSMKDLIRAGLEEDAMLQAKQEGGVNDIVDEIQSVLPGFEAWLSEGKKKSEAKYSNRKQALALDGVDWMGDYTSIKEQLKKHHDEIAGMSPLAEITYNGEDWEELEATILEQVPKLGGGRMIRNGISFDFDQKGAHSIVLHARSAELRAAALASPYVAKRGKLIAGQRNHEDTNMTTLTYAAPVIINGTPVNVGLAIQFTSDGRPRAVNVETESGGVFKINKTAQGHRSRTSKSQVLQLLTRAVSMDTISRPNETVNPKKTKKSDRDIAYSEAIESGDMDMAARLVEQAAEDSMPESKMRTEDGKLRKFYHGTYSKDFTEFDPNLIGTARDGDTGFFGRGFYFAYSRGEARSYGSRVIEAYLNITNPFNFQTELNTLDGETRFDYNTARAVFVVNFAEKFPELAKDKTIGTFDNKGNWREISFAEFAKEYRKVLATVEFQTEELDGAYGKEWLVTADPREESFTNEAGETFRWMEYGFQQRYVDEEMANNKAINAFAYLEKTMFPGIRMPSMAGTIMETDFTDELKRRGFDGAIQSEQGDEAVAFYPEQIKSAAPVTYDDAGNVITLEERFNPDRKDFRFSERDTEAVRRQQAKDRAKLEALRTKKNAKIESVRREEIEKRRAAIKKEKEAKWKKVAETEQKYRDMMSRQRDTRNENAGQAKYRAQVAEKAERLNKMLLTNSDKLHVPEVLKKPLAEFLASIDFSSKSMLTRGTETRADVKFQNALMALNDVLARQERYLNGEEDVDVLAGYFDISAESMDYLREMTEQIHQMMQDVPQGDGTDLRGKFAFTVNAMTAEQLKGLSKLLSNITSAIRNMNNFMANERYQTVREAAEADITYMDSLGKASEVEQSGFADALAWKNGTPYYVLKRFGQGGKAVFDSFARGWERMAFNAKKIIDFTEKVYTDKEVKDWKKEAHDITLSNGSRIKMTTAQIMELSRLLGREQAMKHIEKGGIRIDNIKGKVGNIVDTNHYHLTMEDIAHLMQELTPRQMEVARALQQFMAKQGATWGNEVSMRRFGYNFYDEGDAYYPIRTDSNDRGMQDTEAMQNSMFRLLNLSASKSLNPKASNALIVGDIFDTFADHMADMAKLNGMGLPILDAIKWFNYKERIDLGGGEYDTRTLQGAMERAFGAQAQRYFRTLMKDINGVTEAGDRGTDLASRFISNYKAASVAANLRVAFLQPTSYVRAAAIIDPKYLALAFTNRNAYKEAIANSGTAVWKSLGYYDTNISRGMREQIEHNESWKDKVVEASMTLAELGDKVTWGRLWVACKMQAKARNNSLEGQSLINATADLFREVVYATQVMDSTLTRSELMRGKTLYTKAMTAFMAEPTLSYNLLMDAFGTFHRDVKRLGKQEAWKRNNGKIYTAISTYVASAAFAAVVESVADAFRDDDNDEFWQKFLEALFGEGVVARIKGEKSTESILKSVISGNLAQDLTIIGKLPYVKSMISTLQGYKSKDMTSAAFDAIIDSVKIWQETAQLANGKLDKPTKVTYYGNMTDWGKVYKSLQALSQLTGFGASNLARDVLAIWNATAGAIHPDWKVKTYQSKSERTYLDTVYPEGVSWSQYDTALKGMDTDENGSYKQDEAGPYLNGEVAAGRMTQEQAEAIWRAVGPTWKKTLAEWTEKNS